MSHLTRCPNCATTFRVSDAQLALRGGRVRCGHCSFVFNAMDCQVEADPVTIIDLRSDPTVLEHDPFWDNPADADAAPETAPPPATAPDAPRRPEPEAAREVPAAARATPARADAWLEDLQELPPPSWLRAPSAPVQDKETAPAAEAAVEVVAAPAPAPLPEPEVAEPTAPAPVLKPVVAPPAGRDWLRPAGRSPWRWVWRFACLLLLAAAVAQAAVLLRASVIQIYPPSRPLLTEACSYLGCQVLAPQNLDFMQIEGVEFSFDPQDPQRLQLNAVLGNYAPFAQGWPLLDVQLLDRNGQRVARRVLRPAQYLPVELRQPGREFNPQQEVQISATLHLDGVTVENYSVDLLPAH